MKKNLLAFFLVITIIVTSIPISTFAKSTETITEYELEIAILETFNWAKQGYDILLNDEFLENVGTTDGDWFPIAMGIYGYETDTFNNYLSAIEDDVTEKYATSSKLDRNKATEWHRISLAVTAMGGDPTDVGGEDLIADGTYNCVVSSVDRQGINGTIWALIALDSMNYSIPSDAKYQREDLIALILERQMSDGGFTLGGSSTNDLASDPDITAMALQALAPYKDSTETYIAYGGEEKTVGQVIEESLNQMSLIQEDDGDFSSWGTQNVESTAQMLIALTSLGIDPYEDERFIKNGNTLIDGILKYKTEDGGFAHSFINDPENPSAVAGESNRMASEQAVLGLISYYKLINNDGRLYDFTEKVDEDVTNPEIPQDGVLKDIPWIVLGEFRLSGNGNEKFAAVFEENVSNYTIKVPYGFKSVYIESTPFNIGTTTDFVVGSEIIYGKTNQFYYFDDNGEKVEFTITLEYDYYAEPDSIILEIEYLLNLTVTENNQQDIYDLTVSIENRYNALEFSYEKCYIDANVNVNDTLKIIRSNLNDVDTSLPDEDDVTGDNELLNALLEEKDLLLEKYEELPAIDKIQYSDLALVEYVELKASSLIEDFESIMDTLSDKDKIIALSAISELEKVIELAQNLKYQINQNLDTDSESDGSGNDNDSNDNDSNDNDSDDNDSDDTDNNGSSNTNSSYTTTTTTTTTIITSKTFNSIIPQSAFEEIMGVDENVKGIGKVGDSDLACTFIFNGTDVINPIDFLCDINTESENSENILKLSPDAFVISLAHQGEMPGVCLVQIESELADGDYILFSYNQENMQAEVIEKITVENGLIQFLIEENKDYFIAKEASLDSLLPKEDLDTDESIEASTEIEIQKGLSVWLVLGIICIALALIAAIILTIILIKRRKANFLDEMEEDVEVNLSEEN